MLSAMAQPARQGIPHRQDQRGDGLRQLQHSQHHPRCTPEARKANQALVDLLGRIAARKHATPAQVALAWLLAQEPWIVPIPGTRRVERLGENLGPAALRLTADDLSEIESAAAQIQVQGARYPSTSSHFIDR
jgi:aryl-alcohol dehydrogenase-like predicted oxidoreductase